MFRKIFKKSNDVILDVRYGASSVDPAVLPRYAKDVPQPTWFRKLKSSNHCPVDHGGFDFKSTVKTCPGIVGTLTTGIYILAPFDLLFYRNKERNQFIPYVHDNFYDRLDFHAEDQMGDAIGGSYLTVKIGPGYSIRCDEPIEFHLSYPTVYNTPTMKYITGPDGILRFNHQHTMNIFLFLLSHINGDDKEIAIKKGTPLVKLTPMTDRNVVLQYTETSDWRGFATGVVEGVSTDYETNKLRVKNT